MKNKTVFMLLLLGLAGAMAWAASAKINSVQVRETQARDKPSFLGRVVASFAYGDQVSVLETQGSWSRVALPRDGSGWLHASALSSKKIVLAAGTEDARVAASGDELALAGKGFNADVEAEFKRKHATTDFAWIDRMEKMNATVQEKQAFLQEGDAAPQGGAR